MSRGFFINGETLVKVKGMVSLASKVTGLPVLWELGLSIDPIRIVPKFAHRDINADDYGPDVPAEVVAMLAECSISMTLVHFDEDVLRSCLNNSMAGMNDGVMVGAGTSLGRGVPLLTGNNCFISLNLLSPVGELPWHFPASYLTGPPMEMPIGTEKSMVRLHWRAIPYKPFPLTPPSAILASTSELTSSGAVLWDRNLDTD